MRVKKTRNHNISVTSFQMKWQDGYDEKKTILNVRLSKIIGLYQILDPEDLSVRGYNVYRAMAAVMLVFEAVVLVLSVTGVYYWMGSQSYSVTQLGNSTNILCTLYKMWILIRQPERIRDCLRVAGEDFMASGGCGTAGFRRARAKALFVTSCYVTMGFMILFLYSVTPYVYSNNYLMLKGPDGERQAYHLSVFNLYFPVSTAAYNRYFTVFHAIEIMFGLVWVIYSHVFDLFAITMCFSISNQLKTIGIAFATLGRKTIENRGQYAGTTTATIIISPVYSFPLPVKQYRRFISVRIIDLQQKKSHPILMT